jgi:hypothetical protein
MTIPTAGGFVTLTVAENCADPMLLGETTTSRDCGFMVDTVSVGFRCTWAMAVGTNTIPSVINIIAAINTAVKRAPFAMVFTLLLRIFPSYLLIAI